MPPPPNHLPPKPLPPASDPPPKPLDHHWPGDGPVTVTWALSGLRTARVAVPYHRWIHGGDVNVGRALDAALADLDFQAAAIRDSLIE